MSSRLMDALDCAVGGACLGLFLGLLVLAMGPMAFAAPFQIWAAEKEKFA